MTEAARSATDWRVAVYVAAGVSFLLLLASLTGRGAGMFGWGFMMAGMWAWGLAVIIGLVLLGYVLGRQSR